MARTRQITRPWTQQPQGAASIDWSNPLTRGLRLAYNGATWVDAVTGMVGVSEDGSATRIATAGGLALAGGGAHISYPGHPTIWPAATVGPHSMVALIYVGGADWSKVAYFLDGDRWGTKASADVYVTSSSELRLENGSLGEVLLGFMTSRPGLALVGFSADPGVSDGSWVALDGSVTTRTGAAWTSPITASTGTPLVGISVGSGNATICMQVWDRAISVYEYQMLRSALWSAYAPITHRTSASAGGGSLPTLSLPTYMPGSLTSVGFRPRVTAS